MKSKSLEVVSDEQKKAVILGLLVSILWGIQIVKLLKKEKLIK